MKYILIIAVLLIGCQKKDETPSVVSWKITKGQGYLIIQDGSLVTDFDSFKGEIKRPFKQGNTYRAITNADECAILFDGVIVAKGKDVTK